MNTEFLLKLYESEICWARERLAQAHKALLTCPQWREIAATACQDALRHLSRADIIHELTDLQNQHNAQCTQQPPPPPTRSR